MAQDEKRLELLVVDILTFPNGPAELLIRGFAVMGEPVPVAGRCPVVELLSRGCAVVVESLGTELGPGLNVDVLLWAS